MMLRPSTAKLLLNLASIAAELSVRRKAAGNIVIAHELQPIIITSDHPAVFTAKPPAEASAMDDSRGLP